MATDRLRAANWALFPGTLCTQAVFDGFLDALDVPASRRQIFSLEWPSVADYRDPLKALSQDTIVCGFSLGAIVAAHHADQMSVQRLILFGLNPHADDPAKAQGRHDLARDVASTGGAAALSARQPTFHGSNPEAVRKSVFQMADETAHLMKAQTRLALTRPGALPALAKARMPILTLTGALDHAAPPAQGQAAAAAAPDGSFHCLDGLGHFALLEDPGLCATAVIQHMDGCHARSF
jgi:pimeloyl-ACP methyl ester carboxylesterase